LLDFVGEALPDEGNEVRIEVFGRLSAPGAVSQRQFHFGDADLSANGGKILVEILETDYLVDIPEGPASG